MSLTAADHLEVVLWHDEMLQAVEDRLAETACHAARPFDRVIFPDRKAPEVLRATWSAKGMPQPTSRGGTTVH